MPMLHGLYGQAMDDQRGLLLHGGQDVGWKTQGRDGQLETFLGSRGELDSGLPGSPKSPVNPMDVGVTINPPS